MEDPGGRNDLLSPGFFSIFLVEGVNSAGIPVSDAVVV